MIQLRQRPLLGVDSADSYRVRAANFLIASAADWTLAASDWITGQPDSVAPVVR